MFTLLLQGWGKTGSASLDRTRERERVGLIDGWLDRWRDRDEERTSG